jgi:hypothetical protein
MSEELRPCPFCGGQALTKTFFDYDDLEYMPLDIIEPEVTCENERCINGWWLSPNDWNTRPIEDDLRKRIAELEAENIRLGIEYQRMRLALGDIAINSKRALVEGLEANRSLSTVHSEIKRQDNKSPNDTQTGTFVYGKESEKNG